MAVSNCIRVCAHCHSEFETTNHRVQYCSPECKGARVAAPCAISGCDSRVQAKGLCCKHYQRLLKTGTPIKPKVPCGWCGSLFDAVRRAKYCCSDCRSSGQGVPRYKRTCPQCGKSFRTRNKKTEYCSQSCASYHIARAKGQKTSKGATCDHCKTEIQGRVDRRNKRNFCSKTCYQEGAADEILANLSARRIVRTEVAVLNRIGARVRAMQDPVAPEVSLLRRMATKARRSTDCKRCDCGSIIPRSKRKCPACSAAKARQDKRAEQARYKAVRRARVRVDSSFDPYTVFRRDNWTCQGCGCDTPKTLRGTYEDNAPELDHIVPLAAGGTHTIDNAQLLCRVCNILKSDKSMSDFMNEINQLGAGSRA